MLLLPASITGREAIDARRLLMQAIESEPAGTVSVDASNLQQFDSSALAVLLECQRTADARGQPLEVRGASAKLFALARLYGVDVLLMPSPVDSNATGAAA